MTGTVREAASTGARDHVHGIALSVIAFGVFIAILYLGRVVFITSIVAIIIAFILEPFVQLLTKIRLPRPIATFVVSAVAVLVVYFVSMTAFNQLSALAGDFPKFKERFGVLVEQVRDRVQSVEDATGRLLLPTKKASAPPPATTPAASARNRKRQPAQPPAPAAPGAIQEVRIHEDRSPITDYVYARLGTLYQFVLMASFVPFLVFFMLSWRDHIQRSFLRFFEGPKRVIAARSLEGVSGIARAFVAGNFLIGILLAVASSIAFALLHLPYPFLAGTLSGFLSLVPYIGVPVGLVPPLLAVVAGGGDSSAFLLVFVVVVALHVTALNVLYPKLVGARVHLNPLVVTFSLMFWGFLWDAAGLVLAIPITAGLKAVCDNIEGLRPYGRFLGD